MPMVLEKIAVGEGWRLSLACEELDMRTDSVQCWLGMRTDGIQNSALFPSHSPIPGPGVPALALSLLTCLRPTGEWELCLSDLPCPT